MLEVHTKERKRERKRINLKVYEPTADTEKILKEISETNLIIQKLKQELSNFVENKK